MSNAVCELNDSVTNNSNVAGAIFIGNDEVFQMTENFNIIDPTGDLKIIARNPGLWGNNISVAIAVPSSFNDTKFVMEGVKVDNLFEFAPEGSQFGVVVMDGGDVVETWLVSTDPTEKDVNNKSIYAEDVINNRSSYIFIRMINNTVSEALLEYDSSTETYTGEVMELALGEEPEITNADLLEAYELWANKEEIDIDIVIGNERDAGVSALNLCETRKDCIGFIGASYEQVVGKKAADAVAAVVAARKSTVETTNFSPNSMFVVACANYKYQYDRYNDKNRWVNIAGDIAGLRAQTSSNRASWWASAGLERGQIKNVKKLAFNPNQAQRDILYKNALNPIVSFPGQGTVMWGQKTLLNKPSSFDRVNVRGLFNTLERSLSKMAKYQVMEFNDNFTRNRIVSMIKPFLSSVQAGRGVQDFLVICDTSNNTPDIVSRNQLIVDVYIKPTYVAEFIHLKFTNAGTNSFSEVIGAS